MTRTRRHWRHDGSSAVLYDVAVQHARVAGALGRLLWGSDVSRLYSELHRVRHIRDGSLVLDIPCGGGVAFRDLGPEQRVAYVAVDLSRAMIARARRKAAGRRLRQVRFAEADMEALPFRGGEFDLCLAYNSLHCLANPARAVSELVRVLRAGGALRGSTIITSAGPRQDALIRVCRRLGVFGPNGDADELQAWLSTAGLNEIQVETSGAVAFFSGQKPGP